MEFETKESNSGIIGVFTQRNAHKVIIFCILYDLLVFVYREYLRYSLWRVPDCEWGWLKMFHA